MAHPSDGVVQGLARREGLVTALMSQNPQTSTEETLYRGVKRPAYCSEVEVGDILRCQEPVEKVEGDAERDEISSNIVQTSCS